MKKISDAFKKLVAWGKSVYSERDGSGSASRVHTGLIVIGVVAVLVIYVWFKRDLPSTDQMGGLAKILGVGTGSYGVNKLAEKFGKKDEDAPADPAAENKEKV